MSSFINCVTSKIKQSGGNLTEAQLKKINSEYNALVQRYSKTMGSSEAAQQAASQVANVQAKILRKKNEAKIRHALKANELNKRIAIKFEQELKAYNKLNKAAKQFQRKPTLGTVINDELQLVADRSTSIERQQLIPLYDFIKKHGSKWAGLTQDTKGMPDVVRAMLGETTDNADAKEFAKVIRSVYDNLHGMFDDAGGIIGKINNYFPQHHNMDRILLAAKNAGKTRQEYFDVWFSKIYPALDRERIININTGLPFTDDELTAVMQRSYDRITTGGLSDMSDDVFADVTEAGTARRGTRKEVFEAEAQSRFFYFKDADSFLAYNREFGNGDEGLFDAVIGKIYSMSKEIGLMQIMGPKPNAMMQTFDSALSNAVRKGQESPTGRRFTNGMYDTLVGVINHRQGTLSGFYYLLEGAKNMMKAGYLGLASISSLSDIAFTRLAAKMNGIEANKVSLKHLSLLNPANKSDRETLRRTIFASQAMIGQSFKGSRFADDAAGVSQTNNRLAKFSNISRGLANFTHRASGLQTMTEIAQMAITTEQLGQWSNFKQFKTAWKDTPEDFRRQATKYNITEADFNLMKLADYTIEPQTEARLLRPQDIAKIDINKAKKLGFKNKAQIIETALKFDTYAIATMNLAINQPTLKTQAITTGAGLVGGEAAKIGGIPRALSSSFFMFKGFSATVMNNFVLPMMRDALTGDKTAVERLGQLVIVTTLLGAVAIQAKELVKGKTPRDVEDPKFWFASMMQGGSLGIFGDFIFGDDSRYNKTFLTTVMGPVFGLGGDVLKASKGNLDKLIDDSKDVEIENVLADWVKIGKGLTPVANLPYTKIVAERAIFDGIDEAIRGKRQSLNRHRKYEKKMQKQFGNEFWWGR
jgi:hypothetical protein